MNFLREAGLIFWSHLRANLRSPAWVLIGISQPVLYLVLFGPLLKGLGESFAKDTDPWLIFTPGLMMQIGLFGAMFVGFSVIFESRAGIIERQRVTPANRGALLAGRVAKDAALLIVQTCVLTATAAIFFGLRPHPVGVLLTALLVAIIGVGMACASYALALRVRSEDTLSAVLNAISLPLVLLSGILLPMTLAPGWLLTIARLNPLSHTVDAARALFRGDSGSPDVVVGVTVTVVLALVLAVIGARTFQRENA